VNVPQDITAFEHAHPLFDMIICSKCGKPPMILVTVFEASSLTLYQDVDMDVDISGISLYLLSASFILPEVSPVIIDPPLFIVFYLIVLYQHTRGMATTRHRSLV